MRTEQRYLAPALGVLALVVLAAPAAAQTPDPCGSDVEAPLDLFQLYGLIQYVECVEACPQDDELERYLCELGCGTPDPAWERNRVTPINGADLDLAFQQFEDECRGDVVCRRGDDPDAPVVPAPLCTGEICETLPVCSSEECARPICDGSPCDLLTHRPPWCLDVVCDARPARDAADCADRDGDGIPAWLEEALGTSDEIAEDDRSAGSRGEPCTTAGPAPSPCNFEHLCDPSTLTCVARGGCDGQCTAFHLEKVSEDDVQVLVHVHFDFAPLPVNVLDLNIVYDRALLTLEEARPLPLLTEAPGAKSLSVGHDSDGVLRLAVFDSTSLVPIPKGALVELVFSRRGQGASQIAFSKRDGLQIRAIAPKPGGDGINNQLASNDLWGPPVLVNAVDHPEVDEDRLLLLYGFESPARPLDYSNIPDGEALCARIPDCANEVDEALRTTRIARLEALQRGALSGGEGIAGVVRDAVYFGGGADHLDLPVFVAEPLTPAGQSFSFGSWMYSEGNDAASELDASPQLLFAHHRADERTAWGLLLDPAGPGASDLAFFVGDILATGPGAATREVVIRADLPHREWHHVGFSLDVQSEPAKITFYFDGEHAGSYVFDATTDAVACPRFQRGADLFLTEEGSALGSRPAEGLLIAPRSSNRFRLERSDLAGLSASTLLEDGQSSFRDPDYLPILDRLVYSTNLSGSYEIWVSRGDGSQPQQLTRGFGDEERGIRARTPRWAPDGSGIVFESNVFSVLDDHNAEDRGYQLYYLGWDPVQNQPRIELEGGGTATELDYEARLGDQTVGAHQLTRSGNNMNAWFVAPSGAGARGRVLFDHSDERLSGHAVHSLTIPDNLRNAQPGALDGLGASEDESRLLSAFGGARQRLLFEHTEVSTQAAGDFRLHPSADAQGNITLAVEYAPGGFEATDTVADAGAVGRGCWDRNRNERADAREDRNGDGVWNSEDCHAVDLRDLRLRFDPAAYLPRLSIGAESRRGAVLTQLDPPGCTQDAAEVDEGAGIPLCGKILSLSEAASSADTYVRLDIRSPVNATPLPAGIIAEVRFEARGAGVASFDAFERVSLSSARLAELGAGTQPAVLPLAGLLESTGQATFSPDGMSVVIAGSSQARPVLLRVDFAAASPVEPDLPQVQAGEVVVAQSTRIVREPTHVRGLRWIAEQRFAPCNRVGGFEHPGTRLLSSGLRGGLDDLRLHLGVRDPDAFRSTAQLGLERLRLEGRDGAVDSRLPACTPGAHSLCPDYHLCVDTGAGGVPDFRCQMVPCDPNDPYACPTAGRCTLRPPVVEQERPGFDWVCAADCNVDSQCFTQSCLNGPCRFCDDQQKACIECREVVSDFTTTIEGCPDSNSFACVAGACVTECYAFEDGQSRFLCDPTTEYCAQGRCRLLDWDWPDLAPATFSGLSETVFDQLPGFRRSVAIGEETAIELKAYGVADYLQAPQILVEGRLVNAQGALHGGAWIRLGLVTVYNRTEAEAQAHPYRLLSPHPLSDLRARLVTTPYQNMNAGATGLGGRDKDFCRDDATTSGLGDTSVCNRRPPSSLSNLGYALDIPHHAAVTACHAAGKGNCPPAENDAFRRFLRGGHPAVVLLETAVDGASAAISRNDICSYEGEIEPLRADGSRRKLYYGDIAKERSHEKTRHCESHDCSASSLADFTGHSGGAYALLNCNFVDPGDPDHVASVQFSLPPFVQSGQSGAVRETANTCFVELDAVRNELCYEYAGAEALLDPAADALQVWRSLEVSLPRSFAHDRGFDGVPLPEHTLSVFVDGYTGGGLTLRNGADVVVVPGNDPTTVTFPTRIQRGQRYDVRIAAQPTGAAPSFCHVVQPENPRERVMTFDRAVDVFCTPLARAELRIAGLQPDSSPLSVRFTTTPGTATGTLGPHGAFDPVLGRRGDVTLTVNGNGVLPVPFSLREGTEWIARVVQQPSVPSQFCGFEGVHAQTGARVGGASTIIVEVDCVPVVPRRVGVSVRGLEGTLVVGLDVNGQPLPQSPGGVPLGELVFVADGEQRFEGRVTPGDAFEVRPRLQPDTPVQDCIVVSGGGPRTMPNRDVDDIEILCITLPTYSVTAEILGLQGRGLTLRLGDELLPVSNADESQFVTFESRLLDGEDYEVSVEAQPTHPRQICQVTGGSGTVNGADVGVDPNIGSTLVVICELEDDDQSFTIGGEVRGLQGSGLFLSNNGAFEVEISGNGAFTFDMPVADNATYDVGVSQQPSSPVQNCAVRNARGTVRAADVDDIVVICAAGATLEVDLELSGMDEGAAVSARLVNGDGETVGQLAEGSLSGGRARLPVIAPGTTGQQPVSLPAAEYHLYLFIDDDADDPVEFEAGESGVYRRISLSGGEQRRLELRDADLVETELQEVDVTAPGIADDGSVGCLFTHPTGLRPDLPLPSAIALLGSAAIACEAGDSCFDGDDEGSTELGQPLLPGRYDMTCWVDRGGAGGDPDGTLDGADLVGFRAGVEAGAGDSITIRLGTP